MMVDTIGDIVRCVDNPAKDFELEGLRRLNIGRSRVKNC